LDSASAAAVDDVDAVDRRLAPLKDVLGSERIVGYVTDRTAPTDVSDVNDATAAYYKTQYALAPVVVERGTDHRFVIAECTKTPPAAESLCPGARVALDLGGGTFLLERPDVR
jgi:hypothetical protein